MHTPHEDRTTQRRNWFALSALLFLITLCIFFLLVKNKFIQYNQREINKRFFNPLIMRFAGKAFTPQAVLFHRGRKSGREYQTPITLLPISDGYIIMLTYGAKTDWSRNVLAAGECTVQWHGETSRLVEPEICAARDVVAELRSPYRQSLTLASIAGIQQVFRLKLSLPARENHRPVPGHPDDL
jgi:deazaflavin-dependent oxidoreductase (nitroreductase family)